MLFWSTLVLALFGCGIGTILSVALVAKLSCGGGTAVGVTSGV
jgi:hypothetical protein